MMFICFFVGFFLTSWKETRRILSRGDSEGGTEEWECGEQRVYFSPCTFLYAEGFLTTNYYHFYKIKLKINTHSHS